MGHGEEKGGNILKTLPMQLLVVQKNGELDEAVLNNITTVITSLRDNLKLINIELPPVEILQVGEKIEVPTA